MGGSFEEALRMFGDYTALQTGEGVRILPIADRLDLLLNTHDGVVQPSPIQDLVIPHLLIHHALLSLQIC
jgi:hypothetical protein